MVKHTVSKKIYIDNVNQLLTLKKFFKKMVLLKFCDEFNQNVNNLPIFVIELVFGNEFNKSVDNLPINLTILTFGMKFNKSVNNLPNFISELTFGKLFNQCTNYLPTSIKILKFDGIFTQLINDLPNSIINLTINAKKNESIKNLPSCIIELKLFLYNNHDYQLLNNLQTSISKLSINMCLNFTCSNLYVINNLSNTVTNLTLDSWKNIKIFDYFPNSIKILVIHWSLITYRSLYFDMDTNINKIKLASSVIQFINIPISCSEIILSSEAVLINNPRVIIISKY